MNRPQLHWTVIQEYFDLPNGLIIFLLMSFLIMFDFNMLINTLSLYCTSNFYFTEDSAWLLNRCFITLTCLTCMLGGVLGHRLLGYRLSIVTGLVMINIGLYLLCFHWLYTLYAGLGFFTVGLTITVPSIFIAVSYLFNNHPKQQQSGFTLFFTCVTLGGVLTSCIAMPIANEWGFQGCFLIAAICTMLALMVFIPCLTPFMSNKHFLALRQLPFQSSSLRQSLLGLTYAVLLALVISKILYHTSISDHEVIFVAIVVMGFCTAIYFGSTPLEKPKLSAFYFLLMIAIGFWTLYMFIPSILTMFIERHVDQTVLDHPVSIAYLLNINPMYVVALGSVLFFVWRRHFSKGSVAPAAQQFSLAIVLMGLAFFILDLGIYYNQPSGKATIAWVLLSYVLQGLAQLYILPTGAALVCKLTPKRHHGFFMGLWIFSIQIGNTLASQLVSETYKRLSAPFFNLSNQFYAGNFTRFGILALTLGLLTGLLAPKIQSAMEQ